MKKLIFFLFCILCFSASSQTWTNPFTLSGEWIQYGVGDPYIMKYNGIYYLYCSTKDNNVGVKCWSSKDLITWSNAVTCSSDVITNGAYAPEVVYWNGTFYMYTSPAGNGHYVLTSKSPTGPFTVVTGNLGHNIDGDVLIDDNGSWYFYYAGQDGLYGCSMSSPTLLGTGGLINCRVGDGGNTWSEGPSSFKRNGIYYMIYTGNHVRSYGYRTDYAINTISPLSSYNKQVAQNPILIKTEGSFVGLGHGHIFIGPDLDSYFFSYHNLAGDFGYGPYRRLDYDRVAWNGDKMLILGPTTWAQQAPQLADMSDYFTRADIGSSWTMPNGGNWSIINQEMLVQDVMNETTETWHKALNAIPTSLNYTAEFTMKEETRGNDAAGFGAVFGYTDESNYGMAVIHSFSNQLEINFQKENIWGTATTIPLPVGFDCTVWHNMRIEKSNTNYKFFVDGLLKAKLTSNLGQGKVGYMTNRSHGDFSYIAFSNQVNGSGIFDTYKPIPGTVEAVHYNSGGEGVGYHDLTPGNSGGMYSRQDSVDIRVCPEGGYNITDIQTGEWYKYNVNVQSTGIYNVGLRFSSTVSTGQIRIWQGDANLTGIITLPSTEGVDTWRTFTLKGLNLLTGYQTLKVEIVNGGFELYKMEFQEGDNTGMTKSDTFDTAYSPDWNYSDGTWTIDAGQAFVSGYGKRTMGSTGWSDYTIQTDITYNDVMNAGIIFRVNNPANGGAGDDPVLGTDFYQGYFVGLTSNSVILGKQNYNWAQLASGTGTYSVNTKYTIKIVTSGSNIKVYVTDMNTPKIDYTDPNPFINGKVGFRSFNSHVHFDNFNVTTNGGKVSGLGNTFSNGNMVELFPNPVNGLMTIKNIGHFSDLVIYKNDGREMYKTRLTQDILKLNMAGYQQGLYFVKLSNNSGSLVTQKFMIN
jgi:xylan 1,4-beta-xylosidase